MLGVVIFLGIFVGAMVVVIFWHRVHTAILKRRYTAEELAELKGRRVLCSIESDWVFYEHHLERPIPTARRELSSDQDLMSRSGYLECGRCLGIEFQPLHKQGLLKTKQWIGYDVVAIAQNLFGDPIYLRPGKLEPDVVYITYHDPMETEALARSVEDFVQRLRELNPPPQP